MAVETTTLVRYYEATVTQPGLPPTVSDPEVARMRGEVETARRALAEPMKDLTAAAMLNTPGEYRDRARRDLALARDA